MGYGYVCRNCVFRNAMCNGFVDEHGHCDFRTTEREERYERRLRRGDKIIKAIAYTIFAALSALLISAFIGCVQSAHAKECAGAGKCSWAWCENYNGSDHLHDFSL